MWKPGINFLNFQVSTHFDYLYIPGLSGPGADRTDEKEGSYVVYNQYIRQSFGAYLFISLSLIFSHFSIQFKPLSVVLYQYLNID